ncbi:MAG: hypothetical protein IKO47_07255 [Ruminococcus sp.]|nr:hypothetical protein [Ruminococcus sp.]
MKKYICFADFEFTCGKYAERHGSEVLSAGIVICDENFVFAESYYSTARPVMCPVLAKRCIEITGLTQEEIDASPDSEKVFSEIKALLAKYSVDSVYVWGNFDSAGIRDDILMHCRAGKPCASIRAVGGMICDIQNETISYMGLPQAVNISELSTAVGYIPENGSFHNALTDASALFEIHKAAYTTDLSKNEKFCLLRQERFDKIAAIKTQLDEKRREEALVLPLVPEEEKYLSGLPEDGERRFFRLRHKFVTALTRSSGDTDFVFMVFRETGKVKVVPKRKFSPGYLGTVGHYVHFKRKDWQYVFLDELKKL